MQLWKSTSVTVAAVLVACQFVPVHPLQRTPVTPATGNLIGNAQVETILHRSCEACHSSSVPLPWYGHVAPASWLVVSHVDKGIKKWDLAVWSERKPLHGEKEDMCDSVNDHSMPLPSYTWVHPRAKLTEGDIDVLCKWAEDSGSSSAAPKAVD